MKFSERHSMRDMGKVRDGSCHAQYWMDLQEGLLLAFHGGEWFLLPSSQLEKRLWPIFVKDEEKARKE